MQNSFTQRFIMSVMAGFAAASLLWMYRHFVEQARYEMNEGWRDSLQAAPAKH